MIRRQTVLCDDCMICDVLHNVSVPLTASRTLGGRLSSGEHVFVTIVTVSVFFVSLGSRVLCQVSRYVVMFKQIKDAYKRQRD